MTTSTLAQALPLVELGCAGWLMRRGAAERYPAFTTYLVTEAFWHVLNTRIDYNVAVAVSTPFRLAMRSALVLEACQVSRVSWRLRWVAIAAAVAGACLLPAGGLFAARQVGNLALAGVAAAVAIWRAWRPVLANRRAGAHRLGVAALLAAVALPGAYVRGGLLLCVLPWTRATWGAINTGALTVLAIAAVATSAALCWTVSRRAGERAQVVAVVSRRAA